MQYFTIGEFAKYCGTTVEFLKYYDREGLLKPVDKDEAGHRLYASYQTVDLAELYKLSRLGFQLKQAKHLQSECSLDEYEACLRQQRDVLRADIAEKEATLNSLEETLDSIHNLQHEDHWVIQDTRESYFCLPKVSKSKHLDAPWWKISPDLPEYWQRVGWSPDKGVFPNNDSPINGYGWGNMIYEKEKIDPQLYQSVITVPSQRCLLYWYTVPSERDNVDAHITEKTWSLEKPLSLLKEHCFIPDGVIYKRQLLVTHGAGKPYLHLMVRIPLK